VNPFKVITWMDVLVSVLFAAGFIGALLFISGEWSL